MANAYTPHPCDMNSGGQFKCEGTDCGDNDKGERYDGVCDKDGCDINPYRMGQRTFFGRGAQFDVDTTRPMVVVTQFLTADGTDNGPMSEQRRFYVQDGNVIESPITTILGPDDTDSITDQFCLDSKRVFGETHDDYTEKGGMAAMGESLDRGHVMAISLWDDVAVNMLWLDSAFPLDVPATDPGVQRGDCPGGVESTPEYLRQTHPDGWVSFQNAFVGPIGSFLSQNLLPGGGCCRFEADCGDCGEDGTGWCHQSAGNCAQCTGTFDPAGSPPAGCGGGGGGNPSPSPPAPQPTPAGSCSDDNPSCEFWASSGECARNPAFMLANCRQSCGACAALTPASLRSKSARKLVAKHE